MSLTIQQLNTELASVVETAERSLVQVHNGRRGAGAGTVWHPEGLIVTNAHVVSARTGSLRVSLPDGRTLPARLLALDEGRDVAALVVAATDLPTIKVGRWSRDISPGQWVMALGHVGMAVPVHEVKAFLRDTVGSHRRAA